MKNFINKISEELSSLDYKDLIQSKIFMEKKYNIPITEQLYKDLYTLYRLSPKLAKNYLETKDDFSYHNIDLDFNLDYNQPIKYSIEVDYDLNIDNNGQVYLSNITISNILNLHFLNLLILNDLLGIEKPVTSTSLYTSDGDLYSYDMDMVMKIIGFRTSTNDTLGCLVSNLTLQQKKYQTAYIGIVFSKKIHTGSNGYKIGEMVSPNYFSMRHNGTDMYIPIKEV